jgi:hypothetical protein
MAKKEKEVVAEVKEVVDASEVKEVVEPVEEVKAPEEVKEVEEGKEEEKVSEVVTPSTEDVVPNEEEGVADAEVKANEVAEVDGGTVRPVDPNELSLNTPAGPESFIQEQMDTILNEVFTVPGEAVLEVNEKYPVLDIDILAEKINLLYKKDKGDSATFREAYETCRWNCIRFGLPLKNYDEI